MPFLRCKSAIDLIVAKYNCVVIGNRRKGRARVGMLDGWQFSRVRSGQFSSQWARIGAGDVTELDGAYCNGSHAGGGCKDVLLGRG